MHKKVMVPHVISHIGGILNDLHIAFILNKTLFVFLHTHKYTIPLYIYDVHKGCLKINT